MYMDLETQVRVVQQKQQHIKMKFAHEIFPKGSLPEQRTDGAYIDGFLASNLDIYAKRLIDDMHFLLIIAGNDAVGNGKSTLATQIGAYLTYRINEMHKLNLSFTAKNVVFKGGDLAERSFSLPKYSVVLLDESDDLKQHAMKETTIKLKRYFRKCRQQNQILILITPSFFELSKFYALARSHCLINVKFHDDFRRGIFDFYGPTAKKKLYLKGKKEWDYDVQPKDFDGAFAQSYLFFPDLDNNILEYKRRKYEDMVNDAEQEEPKTTREVVADLKAEIFYSIYENTKFFTIEELAKHFGITSRTGRSYLEKIRKEKEKQVPEGSRKEAINTIIPSVRENFSKDLPLMHPHYNGQK